ncbi:DeoR family transcriptional regulator [Patescibacteria group bacterium]|nr:DeoR family transcriptional regulator [Patescibacteria group bacterium]
MEKSQDILRRALDLTLAIYRLTDKLPKGEVLISQLRKLGNEAVGDLIMDNFSGARKKIDLLLIYFKISQAQNWVSEINWLILKNEYQKLNLKIAGFWAGERPKEEKRENIMSHNIGNIAQYKMSHNVAVEQALLEPVQRRGNLSSRQQKILEEFKNKDLVKMVDLIPLFKKTISERTIRNDLQVLIKNKLINKKGERKSTVYFSN